jgi:hydrogenase expression/formation protein HypE
MKSNKKCISGSCPTPIEADQNLIRLSEGSGGREMQELISQIRGKFGVRSDWKNTEDDAASIEFGDKKLVFTSDSYVVTPIFFPGGDIGKIAFCGTVNDLAVMGARPLGLSLSFILEEGFSKKDFFSIVETIGKLSKKYAVPIVTGDTKVVENGSVDKIIINTSGVGVAETLLNRPLKSGDQIIVSGGIGEHGAALLARRFELETSIVTDSRPLWDEISSVRGLIKQAKDITRGGLAAIANEMAGKNKKQFLIYEEKVPIEHEVRALTEIMGIELYNLACEGRFVCIASRENSSKVVKKLKKFNKQACIVGEVSAGKNVIVQTRFGKKVLNMPHGNIVPRIC